MSLLPMEFKDSMVANSVFLVIPIATSYTVFTEKTKAKNMGVGSHDSVSEKCHTESLVKLNCPINF